jgi:hypothetical protein
MLNYQTALSLIQDHPLYLINLAKCFDLLNDSQGMKDTLARCKAVFTSKDPSVIRAEFSLSEANMNSIRSRIEQLSAKIS